MHVLSTGMYLQLQTLFMLGVELIARAHCLAHASIDKLLTRPDKKLQKYALLNTQHDVEHLLRHHLRP